MLGSLLTAIVTPFAEDGSIDFEAFEQLAIHLCDHGSDGVVVAGTTGEAPTLSERERTDLFRAAVAAVGDRASVVRSIANARAGAMPGWSGRLDEATLKMLAIYVHSLGGGR